MCWVKERLRREVSSFCATRPWAQPWQGLCNLMQLLLKHRLSSAFESAATLGAQRREWQFGALFYARLSAAWHSGSVRCVYVPMSKLLLWETFASVKTQREVQVLICPRMACLQTAIWHLSCAKKCECKYLSCTVLNSLPQLLWVTEPMKMAMS